MHIYLQDTSLQQRDLQRLQHLADCQGLLYSIAELFQIQLPPRHSGSLASIHQASIRQASRGSREASSNPEAVRLPGSSLAERGRGPEAVRRLPRQSPRRGAPKRSHPRGLPSATGPKRPGAPMPRPRGLHHLGEGRWGGTWKSAYDRTF